MLVGDVLHADKFHKTPAERDPFAAECLMPAAEALLKSAVAVATAAPERKKLQSIVNFWATSGCIDEEQFDGLRCSYAEGVLAAQGGGPPWVRTYKLPKYHGIRDAAWYHLPASLMAEELIYKPGQPTSPEHLRARRLSSRRASPSVRAQLDQFFETIDLVYRPTGDNFAGETKKYHLWLDNMGQIVAHDKATGETKTVCNGYGWSPDFARQMMLDGIPSTVAEKRAAHHRDNQHRRLSSEPSRFGRPTSRDSEQGSSDFTQYNRPTSRDSDRGRYFDRRPSSRDYDDRYQDGRHSSFGDTSSFQRHSSRDDSLSHHHRSRFHNSGPRIRANDEADGTGFRDRDNSGYTQSYQGFTQAPNQFTTPPAPPMPPMQYAGHAMGQSMQSFPYSGGQVPPPPFHHGSGAAPPPPPPPSSYNGSYNNAANMTGPHSNAYPQGANNPGYGYQADNSAYNNNRGGHSSVSRGGNHSGFRGGYQGRAGNRGRYRGGYRGGNQSNYDRSRGGRQS